MTLIFKDTKDLMITTSKSFTIRCHGGKAPITPIISKDEIKVEWGIINGKSIIESI